jgi:hypothetical protein
MYVRHFNFTQYEANPVRLQNKLTLYASVVGGATTHNSMLYCLLQYCRVS